MSKDCEIKQSVGRKAIIFILILMLLSIAIYFCIDIYTNERYRNLIKIIYGFIHVPIFIVIKILYKFLKRAYGDIPNNQLLASMEFIKSKEEKLFPASSIPYEMTEFKGRKKELEKLSDFIKKAHHKKAKRLEKITIFGIGGSGKTRLALEDAVPRNKWICKKWLPSFKRKWIALYIDCNNYNFSDDFQQEFIDWRYYHHLILIVDNYNEKSSQQKKELDRVVKKFKNETFKTRIIKLSYARIDDNNIRNIGDESVIRTSNDIYLNEIEELNNRYPIEYYLEKNYGLDKYIPDLIENNKLQDSDYSVKLALSYIFLRFGGVTNGELKDFGIGDLNVFNSIPLITRAGEKINICLHDSIALALALTLLNDYQKEDVEKIMFLMWKNDENAFYKKWLALILPIPLNTNLFDLNEERFKDESFALKRLQGAVYEIYLLDKVENYEYMEATYKLLEDNADRFPDNQDIQIALSRVAVNVIFYYREAGKIQEMEATFELLKNHADRFPDNQDIQLRLSWGAVSVITIYEIAGKLPEMEAAFELLKDQADRFPDNQDIQLRLSEGAVYVINDYGKAGKIQEMEAAFELLKAQADRFPDNQDIRILLSRGAFNVITAYGRAGK
ncbi:MAG: hypothetical protein B0D92_08270, partial [Spirochaeta sp. LUC14_002_19_P3]